jgi:hypothetical protein
LNHFKIKEVIPEVDFTILTLKEFNRHKRI